MLQILAATSNQHKVAEFRSAFAPIEDKIQIITMNDIPPFSMPEETGSTFEENAMQKARSASAFADMPAFADDSGLEVEALDGRPGVYSARYAGEGCSYQDNVLKILEEMRGETNRRACFKTVVALILDGKQYFFEGRVDGEILTEQRGKDGFGYDPIFKPLGFRQTFAEMSPLAKNMISHRARAMQQLKTFLDELNSSL